MERHFLGQTPSRPSTTFHNALFLTPYAMSTALRAMSLYEKLHAIWMRLYNTDYAGAMSCHLLLQPENLIRQCIV